MNYSNSRGPKTSQWLSNMMLRSDDINKIGLATYENMTDMLATISRQSAVPEVIKGLELEPDTAMTATLKTGAAISFDGSYLDSEGAWGFVAATGSPFSVWVPVDTQVSFDDGQGQGNPRIDTLEIRPIQQSYDQASRQFKDPITGSVTSALANTRREYDFEFQILKGTAAASPVAPASTAGWIKIAEVTVADSQTTLTQSDIVWVTDSYLWTTGAASTLINGTTVISVTGTGTTVDLTGYVGEVTVYYESGDNFILNNSDNPIQNNVTVVNGASNSITVQGLNISDNTHTIGQQEARRFMSDNGVLYVPSSYATPYAQTLLDDPDAETALTTLGFSSFTQTLIDDIDASEARNTLEVLSEWVGVTQIDSQAKPTGVGSSDFCRLGDNVCASVDGQTGNIERWVYDPNAPAGSRWSLSGSTSLIPTGSAHLIGVTALSSTRIVVVSAVSDAITTYDWNGSNWVQVGNPLSVSTDGPRISALSSTDIAFVDNGLEVLRRYSFDGVNWSQVGSDVLIGSIPNGISGDLRVAAMSETRVAFTDTGSDQLRTYDWNGSAFAQTGNSYSFPSYVRSGLASVDENEVLISFEGGSSPTDDGLRLLRFDGTDWREVVFHPKTITGGPSVFVLSHSVNGFLFVDIDSGSDTFFVNRLDELVWTVKRPFTQS